MRSRIGRVVVSVLSIAAACAWTAANAGAGARAARTVVHVRYTNPVFSKPFPDPMVLRFNAHDYWAYGTSLGWQIGYFPILHSTDFVHWKYVGDAFKQFPSWGHGDFWAPDVVRHGKTYYLYYTGMGDTMHCIGVATSPRPAGPFHDRGVVSCGDAGGTGYIDPDLFIDRGGHAYLYVSVDSVDHHIAVLPMRSDLLHSAGAATTLFGVSQSWERSATFSTVEGPFMVRRGSRYYLFYSGNAFEANYAMGVATGSSPVGPFTKCSCNPIMKGDRRVLGPGGGSVTVGPDGKLWMVYHGWSGREGGSVDRRTMRIDPIQWRGSEPEVRVTP